MRQGRIRNKIAGVILALCVCVMAVTGYKWWEGEQAYREGNENYDQLTALVRPGGPPVFVQGSNFDKPDVPIPHMDIDFDALQAVNQDAVAWLYCPDTVIDYPVMRATEYDYYLRHLPDGTYNINGTLFIDYHNAADFSDSLTIIYGHHMDSGRMFGSLVGYKEQDYYAAHPYMYLYTRQGNYRIDLMYGCVIGAGEWRERSFMFKENLGNLMAFAAGNTTFASDLRYTEGDRIIAMSTCSYEFDDARYVVVGLLRPEYGSDSGTTSEAV